MNSPRRCRLLAVLVCLLLLLQGLTQADSQEDPVHAYIDSVRIDLAEGNVRLIDEAIGLSDEEAAVFWPLYQEYEAELFELGDRRLDLMDRFIASDEALNLDDSEAQKIAAEWFELEEARFALWKKYHKLIAVRLSPLRAIQFVQTEHRIRTVVDLMIAAELPLFRHGLPSAPTGSGASAAPGSDLPRENSQVVAITASWQGDYPVDALDRMPTGQREAATGYIADAGTFASIWRAFRPEAAVPQVDFKSDLVVFARNVHFYNRTRIAKVQMKDGALEVLAAETMSATPIEDKVAMALAVVSRQGVEAVKTGDGHMSLSSP